VREDGPPVGNQGSAPLGSLGTGILPVLTGEVLGIARSWRRAGARTKNQNANHAIVVMFRQDRERTPRAYLRGSSSGVMRPVCEV
jgi:hypothetical protein